MRQVIGKTGGYEKHWASDEITGEKVVLSSKSKSRKAMDISGSSREERSLQFLKQTFTPVDEKFFGGH